MPIWTYEDCGIPERAAGLGQSWRALNNSYSFDAGSRCPYCTAWMVVLAGKDLPAMHKGMNARQATLLGCPACGWWKAVSLLAAAPYETYDGGFCELRTLPGVLRHLDVSDLSVPVGELRSYLLARYSDRFLIHPRKYEEIVAGVFSDFGYRVRLTSYSGDEGIDLLLLDGDDHTTVGVQVKRYRGRISAEQIRSFVGALVLQGLTEGVYVTTSDYESGARRTADAANKGIGVGVRLLDATRFYQALQISTRARHWEPEDPSAPYHQRWREINEYLAAWYHDQPFPNVWREVSEYTWGSSW